MYHNRLSRPIIIIARVDEWPNGLMRQKPQRFSRCVLDVIAMWFTISQSFIYIFFFVHYERIWHVKKKKSKDRYAKYHTGWMEQRLGV